MKSWYMAGSHPADYEHGIDTNSTYEGKNVAYLKSVVDHAAGFGTLMQWFKADDYRNKRMRFSAQVKSQGIEGWAGLWMRVDGPQRHGSLRFDNMEDRPIKGTTDWHKYDVVLDVPPESVNICFGILLDGKGQAWLSDVQFEEVGADVPTTSDAGEGELPEKPGNLDFAEDGA